jgi:hypothetical protein
MARTTTREIIRVCADLAKLDRRAKEEVLAYLQDELKDRAPRENSLAKYLTDPSNKKPATYPEGGEQ